MAGVIALEPMAEGLSLPPPLVTDFRPSGTDVRSSRGDPLWVLPPGNAESLASDIGCPAFPDYC